MSLKQRRDHKPRHTGFTTAVDDICLHCGDPIEYVEVVGYDASRPVSERRVVRGYWRHTRRWQKKP